MPILPLLVFAAPQAAVVTPAQKTNSQILDETRQAVKDGNRAAILPLLEGLRELDAADRSRLIGLVSETMAMSLELQDRPLMLAAVRVALRKVPAGTPASVDHCQLRLTEARLLEVLERHDEALAVLDRTIPIATDAGKFMLTRLRDHLGLVGHPAPPVLFGERLGEFKGLDAWRGKVVVLDFFAHWCKPCIAAFPEMKTFYASHHAKGFEILGMTEYYGYYGAQKGLTKEQEFEAMRGFVREKELPWPVAFVSPSVKETYHLLAYPNVVVIDRKGTVREVGFGFYPGEAGKLRSLVERLVAEK